MHDSIYSPRSTQDSHADERFGCSESSQLLLSRCRLHRARHHIRLATSPQHTDNSCRDHASNPPLKGATPYETALQGGSQLRAANCSAACLSYRGPQSGQSKERQGGRGHAQGEEGTSPNNKNAAPNFNMEPAVEAQRIDPEGAASGLPACHRPHCCVT